MSVSAKNDQGFESCRAELKQLFNKKKKKINSCFIGQIMLLDRFKRKWKQFQLL